MYATHHRLPVIAASVLAALVLATPAVASEDCDDDDECEQNTPAQVLPAPPALAPSAPAVQAPAAPLITAPQPRTPHLRMRTRRHIHHRLRPHVQRRPGFRRVSARTGTVARGVALRTVPRGGVQAGAGGMAPRGRESVLLGLAGGMLVMLGGGGLFAAVRARSR